MLLTTGHSSLRKRQLWFFVSLILIAMPAGPNWILPKSAPWHFVQLEAQLLSTEDSIGAEAPIPPIPPAQQEKREVPLGGRHRCSMDWSWTIDLVQLGIWQSLNEIMTLLESKQDRAEGRKVYSMLENGLHDQELRKSDEAELEAVTFEANARKGFVN